MNKGGTALTVAGILLLATSCQRDGNLPGDISHTSKIVPVVQSVSQTKTAVNAASDYGKLIAEYKISDSPDNELFLQVYERDFDQFNPVELTRGLVVTTDRLNNDASYKEFHMQAYADAVWHDNTIAASQSGSADNPYDKGLYFGGTDGILVSKGADGWSMASEQMWLNEVHMSFWSWNGVKPNVTLNTSTGLYDQATISDFTVNSTVTSQIDPIFAYNGEKRTFDNEGTITAATSSNQDYTKYDSDRADDKVDIHFYHALAAVNFDISGVEEGNTVDNIKLNNIYPSGDCSISVDAAGVPQFSWTPEGTLQSFSQAFNSDDFNSEGRQSLTESSKVFLMIPQLLDNSATIQVTFNDVESAAKSIQTGSIQWKAGKYYTYKLSKDAVPVEPPVEGSIDLLPNPWHDGNGNIGF